MAADPAEADKSSALSDDGGATSASESAESKGSYEENDLQPKHSVVDELMGDDRTTISISVTAPGEKVPPRIRAKGKSMSDVHSHHKRGSSSTTTRDQKKKKKKMKEILKGHPEFELTYDLLLGIRTSTSLVSSSMLPSKLVSVGSTTRTRTKTEPSGRGGSDDSSDESSADDDDELDRQFKDIKKYDFPKRGSANTPAHAMNSFAFKDYCRPIFATLREWFGIKAEMYLVKLCGSFNLLEFISNSKSGQFFFYSHDGEFLIKSMTQSECTFLRRILPDYYHYVERKPDTLLTKFYGMYRVKPHGRKKIYFVVMGSVFHTDLDIHRIYDLKGSTHGRSATAKDKEQDVPILKDNDFLSDRMIMRIGKVMAKKLKDQLRDDNDFLKGLNIMDYSLLLGIHYADGFNPYAKGEESMHSRGSRPSSPVVPRPMKRHETDGMILSPRMIGGTTGVGGKSTSAIGTASSPSLGSTAAPSASSPTPSGFGVPSSSKTAVSAAIGAEPLPLSVAPSTTSTATLAASAPSSGDEKSDGEAGDRSPGPLLMFQSEDKKAALKRRLSKIGMAGSDKISRPMDVRGFQVNELVRESAVESDEFEVEHPSIFQQYHGGMCYDDGSGTPPDIVYFAGIIDILQVFDKRKQFEYKYKGWTIDKKTISSVPPDQYAKRMVDFLKDKIV